MAVVHYWSRAGKVACGIDLGSVLYSSFYWQDVNCKRCLYTVPACCTMFRKKKEGGERK